MVKSGAIPDVVHEPPAGIRLLPSAAAYQQREQKHLQASLGQSASPYDAGGNASAASVGRGGVGVAGPQSADGKGSGGDSGSVVDSWNSVADAAAGVGGGGGGGATGWGEQEQTEGAGDRGRDGQDGDGDDTNERRGGAAGGCKTAGGGDEHRTKPSRVVDWKELNRNLNLLLKEEGAVSGRDLNLRFTQKFRKSPFMDGVPLRYAVSAGWLRGVCFDLSNKTYNLVMRVPPERREDPPEGAGPYPPRPGSRKSQPDLSHDPDDIDWKKLSREFQQILASGPLEPREIHVKYHRDFHKQMFIGKGYTMRQAVSDGLLEGITFERHTHRLKRDTRTD
eukprot:jgi/Undpi1/2787/HiC_scaffold_14.g06164.m1